MSAAEKPNTLSFYFELFKDPSDGSPYFYCEATRTTQFEVPAAPAIILPVGWQPHLSADGEAYFFYEPTGETTWDFPRGFVRLPEPFIIHNDLDVYWETRIAPTTGDGASTIARALSRDCGVDRTRLVPAFLCTRL